MYNTEEVKEQLIQYLELGFHPIWLKGKMAKYSWKSFTLTKDNMPQYIKPTNNWGIRAGLLDSGIYLWFIDLDSKDLLGSVIEDNPFLLEAPIVSSGKGFHIYLTWKEDVRTRHLQESRIDVIGNGYVVAPPSWHLSGKQYRFIRPLDSMPPMVNPDTVKLGHETAGTTPIIITKSIAQEPLAVSQDNMGFAGVSEGHRHTTLVRIIGIQISRYFTEEETLNLVLEWNLSNIPPMSQSEVIATVRDCYERYDRFDPVKDIKKKI
jgi:hypothetical protein